MRMIKERLSVHMADALVVPAVSCVMYGASAAVLGFSIHKLRREDELTEKISNMGVVGAFIFAAQMINFTIPGTGSSGHICGGMLASAILGPYAGFITMSAVLIIQCLLFADGGILALGCNVWNMAFYSCLLGAIVFWRPILKSNPSKHKIMLASTLGCVLSLQLGAFSVVLETTASGITELPFGVFVGVMQPIHLAIGVVEGIITGVILSFVYEARPTLLDSLNVSADRTRKDVPRKKILAVFLVLTVVIAGGLSLAASALPDGLEWSIEKLTGSTELETNGSLYSITENLQNITSIFPDYSLPGRDDSLGTSFSGIVGAVLLVVIFAAVCFIVKLSLRRKAANEQN